MLPSDEIGTYYVPEGETRTIRFPRWQRTAPQEDEEEEGVSGTAIWTDDNGTLLAVVEVREADHDGPVLLKQYQASRLVRELLLAAASEPDPSGWVKVSRFEDGGFTVEWNPDDVESAEEAM